MTMILSNIQPNDAGGFTFDCTFAGETRCGFTARVCRPGESYTTDCYVLCRTRTGARLYGCSVFLWKRDDEDDPRIHRFTVLNGKPAYPVAWPDDEKALRYKTIRKGW